MTPQFQNCSEINVGARKTIENLLKLLKKTTLRHKFCCMSKSAPE